MRNIVKIFSTITRNVSYNDRWDLLKSPKYFLEITAHNDRRNLSFLYHIPFRQKIELEEVKENIHLIKLGQVRFFNKNNGRRAQPQPLPLGRFSSQRKDRKKVLKDTLENQKRRIRSEVEYAILERKLQLKRTEKKLRAKGKLIIQDIKETKDKMKEKMEEVIERENVYTIPNLLCVTRIVCSPLLGYLIVVGNFHLALVFMAVASVSDWFDGWIARNYKSQSTKIGSFLDPMADKVLIGTLFLCLTYVDLIPVPLTALIIARDVILVAAGFVIRYRSLPHPRTLSRYFDVTHATAQLAPTSISKINTAVQLTLVASTLAAPVFGYVNHPILHLLWYATATSTVLAATSYILSRKETYRYLKDFKNRK